MARKKKSDNQGLHLWEVVAKNPVGRPPAFNSPEELLSKCQEYFQWVNDNPLWESRIAQAAGMPQIVNLPKMRVMTINALCLYIGITHETWTKYREKENFSEVTKQVDEIIYSNKFEGAAADLINANIIARDLGLKDSTKTEADTKLTIKIEREIKQ